MAVLTESEVRKRIGRENLNKVKEFVVEKGQIITPSAKSYLAERNINVIYEALESEKKKTSDEESNSTYKELNKIEFNDVEGSIEKKYKYTTIFGGKLDYKPEHMTELKKNVLVFKNHKRILFRGKIDSLEAKILEAQVFFQSKDMSKLVEELQDILIFVRNIARAEVMDKELKEFSLIGLTEDEIRKQCYNPEKYFGIGKDLLSYKMGEDVVTINSVRALTREVELSAFEAFKDEYNNVEREDIIKALNRLSSVFWIIIFKIRTEEYK